MNSSFFLALNLMLKRIRMHGIMILQTTITILLLVMIIGRIQLVKDSAEIVSTFSGQNAFYFMPYQYIDTSFDLVNTFAELEINSYSMGEIGNLAFRDKNGEMITAYGYNDAIINSCNLNLTKGSWFTEYLSENVPAIAIGNRFDVGDIVSVSTYSDNKEYTIEIIGKLDPDAYILTFDRSASRGASTAEYFISHPQFELVLPYSSSIYNSVDKTTNPDFIKLEKSLANFVIFEHDYSTEYIADVLSQYGHTTFITDMLSNYDDSVNNELLIYSIACLVFTVLTLVGVGGNNGIQNMLNEHQYIIYYMLGATQKKCVWIEAIRASLLILSSFILALLTYFLIPSLYPTNSFHITALTWAFVFLYLAFVFIITSGVFLYRLGKKNLAAIYKEKA